MQIDARLEGETEDGAVPIFLQCDVGVVDGRAIRPGHQDGRGVDRGELVAFEAVGEGNVVRGRALAGLGDGDGVVGDIPRLVSLLVGGLRDLELRILHRNRRVAARLRVGFVGCGNRYVADGRSCERGVGDGDGVVDGHGRLAFLAKGVRALLGLLAEAIERALGRVAGEIAIRLDRERGLLPVGANHAAVGDVVALGIPNLDAVSLQFDSLRLQKVGNDQVAPDCPRRVVRHLYVEGYKVANVAGVLRCGLLHL